MFAFLQDTAHASFDEKLDYNFHMLDIKKVSAYFKTYEGLIPLIVLPIHSILIVSRKIRCMILKSSIGLL